MDALKDLRGAHLPTEPSLWPPSLTLSFTVILALGLFIVLTYWIIQRRKKRLKPKLMKGFSVLSSSYDHHQSTEKLQADVGIFLRSVILSYKNDSRLLGQELLALKDPLSAIFSNHRALDEVLDLLSKDRFKKTTTLDPDLLLLKTKELITSCRR